MEIGLVRSSSYSQLEYCTASYFATYVLGHSQPTNKKALLGTVVHKVMEVLANCKLMIQNNPKKKKFVFSDEELGDIKFTVEYLNSDKMLESLLDKSYKHYTASASHLEFDEVEDKKFCNDMIDAGITLANGSYDPRNQDIFKAEQPFVFNFNFKNEKTGKIHDLMVRGTMDLVVREDKETLHLIDYKTGKRMDWANGTVKSFEKLYQDFQLKLYYYAIRKLFPEYKSVIVTIIFLRDGGPFTLCFEDSILEEVEQLLKDHMNKVLDNENPQPISEKRNDFKCRKLCHFYRNPLPGSNSNIPGCEYMEKFINHYKAQGMPFDEISSMLRKKDFKVGFYAAPGSTDKDKGTNEE